MLDDPPDPQPDPAISIANQVPDPGAFIVHGVRITVDARSLSENLEGSSTDALPGNFIRKTFSSNVNPRNLSAGLAFRTGGAEYQ